MFQAVFKGFTQIEAKISAREILQDADTLDKVGAVSIPMFLLHYGSKKMLPEQVLAELKKDVPERLRWYYRTMNFPQGKKLMDEGCGYIRDFIQKLERAIDLPIP